ncbi:S-adenosyl-L-methionine:benzoic acid/salicylic acid carboxyl methyltransferase 3-like [Silene latifolia]|uniref:S-adenosyl-L-methionine:benzoic acid/salicylic acid carboxyl methyltransferase 3-like n=1 Tax=Silene latifolia TaxID=37657 RepID=UPI003D7892BE
MTEATLGVDVSFFFGDALDLQGEAFLSTLTLLVSSREGEEAARSAVAAAAMEATDQRTVTSKAGPIIEESARKVYNSLRPECLMIAEIGCSSGPNALQVVSRIIDVIEEASRSINRQCPQFGVFLNDLPGNDFNTLFNLLPNFNQNLQEAKGRSFGPCFLSGIPKSFYGRVFPDKFLHFVHLSYSVHWLSQADLVGEVLLIEMVGTKRTAFNKGNIYIAKTSPPEVYKAYYTQFERDFTLFLGSRSTEMVSGGSMVLVLNGSINSDERDSIAELLGSTLQDMVLEGVIEQEKLDKFNMPFFTPTVEEVRKLVEAERSFALNKLETFAIDWSVDTSQNLETRAKFVAKTIRAIVEPFLTTAFSHAVVNDLFLLFETRVKERIGRKKIIIDKSMFKYTNIRVLR